MDALQMDYKPLAWDVVMRGLSGGAWRILERLASLSAYAATHSGKYRGYVQPSQQWIADQVGLSREQVSRLTSQMAKAGLLRKIWRRPVGGAYQTCIYILVPAARRGLAKLATALQRPLHRVTSSAHKPTHQVNSSGQGVDNSRDRPHKARDWIAQARSLLSRPPDQHT